MNPLAQAYQESASVFLPPPDLTVSEWADRYRYLSGGSSAEPGRWRTSRAPWLRGIMDAFVEPDIEGVVVKSSAQIGKTETIGNVIGYFVHQDPSPIMIVQPTRDDAEDWSKDRLSAGLIDVTRELRERITDERRKGETLVHKRFPGGQLTAAWSNSKSRLAMRPIRIVLLDEVDKYNTEPTAQGDPCERAINRTLNFWNRKWGMFSTPTLSKISKIDRSWELSDQRRFHVPCPHCGELFVLDFFKNIRWDKDEAHPHQQFGKHHPETAYCMCPKGCVIDESDKDHMVLLGVWIPQRPGGKVAGFHINRLYSSLGGESWSAIVARWLQAKDNTDAMQNFYNETLGETWELQGETVETSVLFKRRETYPLDEHGELAVPAGVAVLTAGVDVQKDRLEVKVKGWGPGEEAWDVDYRQLFGDPSATDVWEQLDEVLEKRYWHEWGVNLPIIATMIDSGGHHTAAVYEYCKRRMRNWIFPCKGRANQPGAGLPIVGRPSEPSPGVKLFIVGVDTAKAMIYRRFQREQPGPGFYHYPLDPRWDEEHFAQLTAEKLIVKHKDFRPRLVWEALRERNEALDLEVYALAALEARHVDLQRCLKSLEITSARATEPDVPEEVVVTSPEPAPKPAVTPRRTMPMRGRNNFADWKRF